MEISLDPMKTTQERQAAKKKSGLRTMPFIIANVIFEKVASIGLHANMIMYLRKEYHLDVATGVNILFLWGALSNFTPIIGAFLSDSHLGRFRVIALGTLATLLVDKNLFVGFGRVVSAAWKNRNLSLPGEDFEGWFLNKACIIRNPEKDLTSEGLSSQPWSLCTVKQVEELKSLLKILPIWSTGIFIAATISQHSLYLIQANATNRHVTPQFQIPAGSFVVFTILTMILTIAVYDRAIDPILSRHTRQPRGLTFKQRMGIGLAISCLATTVAALVESKRRKQGINGEIMSAGEIFIKMT
ncbi:putative peptide transporter [Morus notabilis]|uniref:Putative peptide transporter n=1 Tax=Morus notabilis TaxID=981085 RepID=W9RLD1_9ROSA|nr:putative peptide transporter [Morus notabilis]